MAVVIVTGSNASLKLDKRRNPYPTIYIDRRGLDPAFQNEFTYISGLQFLSCYSESYITFDFYLMPFKPTLWLGFITSMLLTFIVLYVYTTWKHKRSPYSIWLSLISLFFEDFTSVPKAIGNGLFYRLIFVTWAPVAVLFTNCYSGLMITELNAPLKETRSQNFDDLVCQGGYILGTMVMPRDVVRWVEGTPFENYNTYWEISSYGSPKKKYKNSFASNNCYRMLSSPIQVSGYGPSYLWHNMLLREVKYFFSKGLLPFNRTRPISFHLSKEELLSLLFLNPVYHLFPKGMDSEKLNYSTTELQTLVVRDIIDCGEKNVFIANLETLRGEMAFLTKNYPSKQFTSGKRSIGLFLNGWWFQGGGRSSGSSSLSTVQRNFQSLVHSGIYSRLKIEMDNNMWLHRKPVEKAREFPTVASLTMQGGIITIFMISGVLLFLALASFFIERYKYKWHAGVNWFRLRFLNSFDAKFRSLKFGKVRTVTVIPSKILEIMDNL